MLPTGVWYQPLSSFPKWKGRGVGLLFGYENEGDVSPAKLDAWCKAAQDLGLKYILQESAAAHWNDANCIGVFLTPDEPNAIGAKNPVQMSLAAAALRTRTNKPLWLSLNGGALLTQSDTDVAGWCACADVVCWFSYPFNYGKGAAGMSEIPAVADKLTRLAAGKQVVLIAECSNQGIGQQDWTKGNDASGTPLSPKMRGPTGDELSMMLGLGLGRGVSGFVMFATIINKGFGGFDGTLPDCETAMRRFNAALAPPIPALQFDSFTLGGMRFIRV